MTRRWFLLAAGFVPSITRRPVAAPASKFTAYTKVVLERLRTKFHFSDCTGAIPRAQGRTITFAPKHRAP